MIERIHLSLIREVDRRGSLTAAADVLCLTQSALSHTIRGLELDPGTLRPRLALGPGGYSGPALRPIALACVHACASAVALPIVGMGGVRSGLDALDLVAAGATALGLGTVLFADPSAAVRVREELEAETLARGAESPAELLGVAGISATRLEA